MRFAAVASDYDGTLATAGRIQPGTLEKLGELVASGRKLILVTGRILQELLALFPESNLCSRIVAENGAVLYRPETKERRLLGGPAPAALIEVLRRQGLPLQIGESIIATERPHEISVLEAIRDLGLEHHVVFNRDSVMVLPPGVNKGTGVQGALQELQLSPHNVVAIGDAENDHALFEHSEVRIAVGDGVPMLREAADLVTGGANGRGSAEALSWIISGGLEERMERLPRHQITLGALPDGSLLGLAPVRDNLMIAGSSASGKSTFAHGILERLTDRGYQVCVIDPEGDYESFGNAITFGHAQRGPTLAEVLGALDNPDAQIVVNLVGLPLKDRPLFFFELLPHLQERRAKTGRPHRILLDETHHLLPPSWRPSPEAGALAGLVFVTIHPEQVSSRVLDAVDMVVALGEAPAGTIQSFARSAGLPVPAVEAVRLEAGEALAWRTRHTAAPVLFRMSPSKTERRRHRRKYAEGELPPHRCFYFRGADGQLNLRAQNLIVFRQLAEGVDEDTWMHHLRKHDYSHWMEREIKDPVLAGIVRDIESTPGLAAADSRDRIARAIEARYTLPVVGA